MLAAHPNAIRHLAVFLKLSPNNKLLEWYDNTTSATFLKQVKILMKRENFHDIWLCFRCLLGVLNRIFSFTQC